MATILIGGVSPLGEQLLNKYIEAFVPDADIQVLKPMGLVGMLRRRLDRADTLMVIMDENLLDETGDLKTIIMGNKKCHIYKTDDDFKNYLIEKFGKLEDDGTFGTETSTPSLTGQELFSTRDVDLGSTSDSHDNSEYLQEIKDLKVKLSQAELTINSLVQQNEENTGGDNTIFVTRINELESQLNEKDAKIRELQLSASTTVVQADSSVVEELKSTKELCAELKHQVETLKTDKDSLTSELSDAKSKVSQLDSMQQELQTLRNEKVTLETTIERLKVEIVEDKEQNATIAATNAELDKKELELNNLKVDLEAKTESYNSLKSKYVELQTSLDAKIQELTNKTSELLVAKENNEEISAKISELESTIRNLNAELENKDTEISTLNNKLKASQENQDALQQKFQEAAEANDTVGALEMRLAQYKNEVSSLTESNESLDGELKDTKKKLQETQEECNTVKAKLTATTDKLSDVTEQLTQKTEEVNNLMVAQQEHADEQSVSEEQVQELQNQNSKLQNEITSLNTQISTLNEYKDKWITTDSELTSVRAELETLQNTTDLGASARVEELEEEMKTMISKDIYNEAKNRCTKLELDLADALEFSKEFENSAFGTLSNIAMPLAPFSAYIPLNVYLKSKFVVMASGSYESASLVYTNIKNLCRTNNTTRYLILDLTTDTSIDVHMGVQNMKKPFEWLHKGADFKSVVSSSQYANAKIISTGLAYYNDVALFNVDWDKRLSELQNVADVVIIHVGCLQNTVSKTLYQTFAQIMRGYICLKGAPACMRTLYLLSVGMDKKAIQNSLVACSKFETVTQELYRKLSTVVNTQILKDTDIIEI